MCAATALTLNNHVKQQFKTLPRPDSQEEPVQSTTAVLRLIQRRPHQIRDYLHHKDVRYAA